MRNRASTPLKKAKLRQSWSKYNLYNISQAVTPSYKSRSFFQQKWTAKSSMRDYHGEQVREGQWKKMFHRKVRSVVPMNPAYLAINDGSLESAGRGSGLIQNELQIERDKKRTPYMLMTFAPLERRLDTAIFRAMFASSARQARQFVVHGAVTVNGQTMKYPGYLLNPGDLFQVEPERVMYATGAPKQISQTDSTEVNAEAEQPEGKATIVEEDAEEDTEIERNPRDVLKELLSQSKSILASPRDKLGAKRKQDLRAFSAAVKRMLSRSQSSTILTDSLEAQFKEIQNQLKIQRENQKLGKTTRPDGAAAEDEGAVETAEPEGAKLEEVEEGKDIIKISDDEYAQLFAALTQMQENPVDETKPYATPWVPRDYMSAFAVIPRYLEVNQNICAAVYLRHPVARPGMGEVPTPFSEGTSSEAFTWYLRRR